MNKVLTTPIKDEDLVDIKAGDIIYLNGLLVTCRDVCHRRLIELNRELPVDLHGNAIFHAGPIVRKMAPNGKWSQSVRRPVCGWKNSRKHLLRKRGLN